MPPAPRRTGYTPPPRPPKPPVRYELRRAADGLAVREGLLKDWQGVSTSGVPVGVYQLWTSADDGRRWKRSLVFESDGKLLRTVVCRRVMRGGRTCVYPAGHAWECGS